MNHPAATTAPLGLSTEELDELDDLLEDLRSRDPYTPGWEFLDGALTALACTRRPVPVTEWLALLLLDTPAPLDPDAALPLLPPFADQEQMQHFLQLWQRRSEQVRWQLANEPESLDEEAAFQPELIDMRGAIASLPEEERAEAESEDIPAFGQIWAMGFLVAVDIWSDDWEPPRDKELAAVIDEALDAIRLLAEEDDEGEPALCMFDENGPPSTSHERLNDLGEAIWAVYDLYQVWQSLGPRVEQVVRGPQPGRNDPCPCGSGKKFKKCCGA